MEKRYKVLRFVATLWKILAWIALVLGVLTSFGALLGGILGAMGPQFWRNLGLNPALFGGGGVIVGIIGFLMGLIITAFQFVMLYATGEIFSVLIAIEENTRATNLTLQRVSQENTPQTDSYPSPAPPPPEPDYPTS
jgi:hypothetical protein